jgi:hypothetical protein
MRTYAVLGFSTTHAALDAEQLLKDLGVPVTPIPVPKVLDGALCGIALRLELADLERAGGLLERADIAVTAHGEMQDV